MIGLVDRDILDEYNKIADLFLVCRTKSEFSNFGFPWKLGEYCLSGKPILTTNVGDLNKYFDDRKHLFIAEPENPDSIANKIIEIFEDYDYALQVGKNSKEKARKEFNYNIEMKKVTDFIFLLLK